MSSVNKPIHLKPFVSRGVPFKVQGEVHVLPVQLFRGRGGIGIRVGDNLLRFDPNGKYLGIEIRVSANASPEEEAETLRILNECQEFIGQPPVDPFYPKDFVGYEFEKAGWESE